MRRQLWYGALVSMLTAACAGAPDQKQVGQNVKSTDQVQKSADNMAKGAEGMAKGFEELAKGLKAMSSGATSDAKPVEPLSLDNLKSVLPDLSGWQRGKPTGERMTAPVNYAEAQVVFEKGESHIEAKVVDSALNQMLVAPFAMFLAVGYEKETEHGYEKGVKIGSYPGWEKWDSEDKQGELNAIVNNRYIVQIEGRNIDDIKVLHTLMDNTNLKRLADLK